MQVDKDKVFKRSLHKEMWDFVINKKGRRHDWPRWQHNGGDVPSLPDDCFSCHYAADADGMADCSHCPFDFGEQKTCCNEKKTGILDKWIAAHGEERLEISKQIRDLPIKPGVNYE